MLSSSVARLKASQHTLAAMRAGEEKEKTPVNPIAPSQISQSNLTAPIQRVSVDEGGSGLYFNGGSVEGSAKGSAKDSSAKGSTLTLSSGHSERERVKRFMTLYAR